MLNGNNTGSFFSYVASRHASVLHVKQHFKMLVCLIDDTGGFILFGVFFFFKKNILY